MRRSNMSRVKYDTNRNMGVNESNVNGIESGCAGSYRMCVRANDLSCGNGGRAAVGSSEPIIAIGLLYSITQ
jgi:hypothetical protein